MKKLALIATIFITVASFFALPAPVSAQDQDHGYTAWTISSNTTIYGVHFNITTFTINSGITATVDATAGMVEIHAQTVNINGTLTATGSGNATDTGTGAGTAADSKNNGGGGGGYGGAGGEGDGGELGGVAYGSSLAPIDMGSGGGSSVAQAGGSGGGAIIIHCIGTFTIGTAGTEVIAADGTAGTTAGGPYAGGGGSGGSIYISAATFTGGQAATTHIHANGGAGGAGTTAYGGGGGGGRIAIHATTDTYAGNAPSVAGGASGGGAATAGAIGTDVTGTALWRTYKGGYTVYDDVFSDYATEHDVYVKGTGFDAVDYTIVFWDALGVKIQVDTTLAGPDISSMRIFARDPDDPAGTWYASVYPDGSVPATSHSETANLQADYAFYVYASAIPEFPTIMAAIGVAGLCFGIYWWMRRKRLKFKMQSAKEI